MLYVKKTIVSKIKNTQRNTNINILLYYVIKQNTHYHSN